MVNQCCGRVPQFETIGYGKWILNLLIFFSPAKNWPNSCLHYDFVGVDGTQLRVDVGTCRQLCHKTPLRPLRRQEFDRYLKKYPNMDPVHVSLNLPRLSSNAHKCLIWPHSQNFLINIFVAPWQKQVTTFFHIFKFVGFTKFIIVSSQLASYRFLCHASKTSRESDISMLLSWGDRGKRWSRN